MKACRILQVSLITLFGSVLFVKGPSNIQSPEKLWANQSPAWGSPYYYYRPHSYKHNYNPYFRYYMHPRVSYRIEASITIKESSLRGEKVTSVAIDGRRLNLSKGNAKGNRGTYYVMLSPGNHLLEWTVDNGRGKPQKFSRKFFISDDDRQVNLLIDGDEFYRQ